jgi:hypothetical protein
MDCEWECEWVAGEGFDEIGRSIKLLQHKKLNSLNFDHEGRIKALFLGGFLLFGA